MKRIVFLFALLYGATLMAQNKAVAVTEVVDKEDKVSYATEIMVRTRLTAAISMKQGYTAYDRVDLQSIMSEQNFQRTGLVDDATIKRLGEMTGASLILIPEVAMSEDGKIYVAVKMLDVTTAQTMMATGQLMGSSSDAVEEGCQQLVAKILKTRSSISNQIGMEETVITLYGYLHVFPKDIGIFQTLPLQLLDAINKAEQYGYDTWRLPTLEELSIMRASSDMLPNFKDSDYLYEGSSERGHVRLVTTDLNAEARKEVRKKAIYELLSIPSSVIKDCAILDDYVIMVTDLYITSSASSKNGWQGVNNWEELKYFSKLCAEYIKPYHSKYRIMYVNLQPLDVWSESEGEVEGRKYQLCDPYDFNEYHKWCRFDKMGRGRDTDNSNLKCIYYTPLPSEAVIKQEMQKYY